MTTTVKVETRCPNMGAHVRKIIGPMPCARCFSVVITEVEVPYQPEVARFDVLPEAPEAAPKITGRTLGPLYSQPRGRS